MKAVVVGAGLAGLSAAYELKKADWQVEVLEASEQAGGRVATLEKQGYRFDIGAVGAGTVYEDYMALVNDLGLGGEVVESSTISAIYRNGKVHEIDSARPVTGLTTGAFSWAGKLTLIKLALDIFKVKNNINIRDVANTHQYDTESSYDYALRRLNRELADYLITPLHRTLNLSRATETSKLELFNALTGLFSTTYITLKGGLAQLPKKLAEHLTVQLNTPVQAVSEAADGVTIRYTNQQQENLAITADACVIATTLPEALKLCPAGNTTLAPLRDIRYNHGLIVSLGYNQPTGTKAMLVMIPALEHEEVGLLFLEHNKGDDRIPEGHSLITVFYDDTTIKGPLSKSPAQLIADTRSFVETVLPELAGTLTMSHITDWGEQALTHPGVGTFKKMHEANQQQDRNSRVQFAGDYFSTAGQNSAIVYGKRAANNFIQAHKG